MKWAEKNKDCNTEMSMDWVQATYQIADYQKREAEIMATAHPDMIHTGKQQKERNYFARKILSTRLFAMDIVCESGICFDLEWIFSSWCKDRLERSSLTSRLGTLPYSGGEALLWPVQWADFWNCDTHCLFGDELLISSINGTRICPAGSHFPGRCHV